jgi:ribosomal protein L37AE/L43A
MCDPTSREHVCPNCASRYIERVRREGIWEYIAWLVGWRVYHCRDCGTYFYDRSIRR